MIEIEVIKAAGIFVGVAVLRSVAGWANKVLEDREITKFEWKKLTQTVVRVGVTSTMLFFSVSGAGIPIDEFTAAAGAYIFDILCGALKDNNNVTRR